MKTKAFIFVSAPLAAMTVLFSFNLLVITACDDFTIDFEPVDSVLVITGNFDASSSKMTSEIKTLGDGITKFGHLWSENNNPPLLSDESTSKDTFATGQPIRFTNTLNLTANVEYFVVAYAYDNHDCFYLGEVKTITGPDLDPIEADFTVDKTECTLPNCSFTFTNTSSGNIASYTWDFGDNQTLDIDQKIPVSHTYTAPGAYFVSLTAKAENGATLDVSEMQVVTVNSIRFDTVYTLFNGAEGIDVVSIPGGGYAVAGTFDNDGDSDVFIIVTDSRGNVTGQKTYNHTLFDEAKDLIRLASGEFVIVGSTTISATNNTTAMLYIRTDPTGQPETDITVIETSDGLAREAFGVLQHPGDGDVVIVGTINDENQDLYVAKYNPDLSRKNPNLGRIPNAGDQQGQAIAFTTDGYLISGQQVVSSSNKNMIVQKISLTGVKVGALLHYGGTPSVNSAIGYFSDTQLYICGYSSEPTGGSNQDIYVARINGEGISDGEFTYPVPDSGEEEQAFDLEVLPGGDLVIAGKKNNNSFLVKIPFPAGGNNPSHLWATELTANAGNDHLNGLDQTEDGGFIATGTFQNKLYLVKFDINGNF